jgi:tRNA(Ile)-lysidine synthase
MPSISQRPSFIDRVRRSLDELGMRGGDAHVLVAVSGGCDSVSLLHLLHLLRFAAEDAGLRVSAAHFDHAMRPDSARDADWVRGLCRAWGISLTEGRAETMLHTEAQARDARYAFLRRAQAELGATFLATAHHADDQAETVLFRVLRGTGISGLAGIPQRSGDGLVRPLLSFRRAEIQRYAGENGIRWRTDATNARRGPARNRIRLDLLPYVERHLAPGARRSLTRLAELAREDEAAWEALLRPLLAETARDYDGALVLVRERLTAYDSTVVARLVRMLLRRLGAVPSRTGTRLALQFITHAPSGRTLELPGGVRITTEYATVRMERVAARTSPIHIPPDEPLVIPADGDGHGRFVLGGRAGTARWTWGPVDADGGEDARTLRIAAEAARFPLALRGRMPGDHIRTHAGTRPLKKVLNEARIPPRARSALPVLADAAGAVLWVPGVARAEGLAPRPGERAITLAVS